MGGWNNRGEISRKKIGIFYGAAAVFSLLVVLRLGSAFFRIPEADLISWDQAERAEEAIRMAKELQFFEIPRFILHVLSLNWWPPLHPLMMLPFFLIIGPSIKAAIIPSLAAFVLAVLAILFVFGNLSSSSAEKKVVGFSFLFALIVTSPFLLSCATWAMLEIFGIALTGFALGFYYRARRTDRILVYRMCGILIFLMWSLKYSYGLFLSLVIVFFELKRSLPVHLPPRFISRKFVGLLKPIYYPVYGLLAVVAWIAFGGRMRWKILGATVSMSSIYNPLMYLYLYVLLLVLFKLRKNWPKVKARLECGQRELLLWGAIPLAIFLALPDKIKAIIKNFEAGHNVKAGVSSTQIDFYLRSLFQDYSLFVPVGVLVLALFLFAVIKIKRAPLGLHGLVIFFFLGYLSLTIGFKLKESRYIATFVPALWVGAAWAVEILTEKFSRLTKFILAGLLFGSTVLVMAFTPLPLRKALDQPWAPWTHHSSAFRPLVDSIVNTTAGAHKLFISGAEDAGFSPLLGWKLEIAHYKQKDFGLNLDSSDNDKDNTASFTKMVAQGKADEIVFLIVKKGKSENRLLKWSGLLRDADDYNLQKEEIYDFPFPIKLLFFRKKT
jgi:hypothetical protein